MLSDEQLPVPGVEYYEGKSGSWPWNGQTRWWETFLVWNGGFNGLLQAACERRWRWNGSQHTIRTDYVFVERASLMALANPKTESVGAS